MLYRNKKTGVTVDVPTELKGNWIKVGGEPKKAPAVPVSKPKEVEEPVKPKRTRKTKK